MGSEFTFYDYYDTVDGVRVNVIHTWLETLPVEVRVKFKNWLLHLEGIPGGQWQRPLVDTLTGTCAGLFEIRAKRSRIQYRILGSHRTGQIPILLHGFIKPGARVPPSECFEALNRLARVNSNAAQYAGIHDYG
jgi:hypothetical protein